MGVKIHREASLTQGIIISEAQLGQSAEIVAPVKILHECAIESIYTPPTGALPGFHGCT